MRNICKLTNISSLWLLGIAKILCIDLFQTDAPLHSSRHQFSVLALHQCTGETNGWVRRLESLRVHAASYERKFLHVRPWFRHKVFQWKLSSYFKLTWLLHTNEKGEVNHQFPFLITIESQLSLQSKVLLVDYTSPHPSTHTYKMNYARFVSVLWCYGLDQDLAC